MYVDIRYYGATWYQQLELPEANHRTYVVKHKYTKWNNDKHTEIVAECALFDEVFNHRGYFVYAYGSVKDINPDMMILLDKKWVKRFPKLLPDDRGDQVTISEMSVQESAKAVPIAVQKRTNKVNIEEKPKVIANPVVLADGRTVRNRVPKVFPDHL